MKAQNVYGRNASRQYREVRTKYVPETAFSKVLSQILKMCFLRCNMSPETLVIDSQPLPALPQVTVGKGVGRANWRKGCFESSHRCAAAATRLCVTKVPTLSLLRC